MVPDNKYRYTYNEDYPKPPGGNFRHNWKAGFNLKFSGDISLALEKNVNVPSKFQEIYQRFYDLGFIYNHGYQCVLMSYLLRRILTLHGFKAHVKQVVLHWRNLAREKEEIIGGYQKFTPEDSIDAHYVVVCNGFILDFSCYEIIRKHGAMAPRAFIGLDNLNNNNKWQNFGEFHGEAMWTLNLPIHILLKSIRYEGRDIEHDLTRRYFRLFKM